MLLLHCCISDLPISLDDYDQEYHLYESEAEPAAINEDSADDEEYWDVSDDEILQDFTQDDNLLENQNDNSLKDEDVPQSDNVCIGVSREKCLKGQRRGRLP